MKRLCWLVGHTEVFNDSGYPVCSCGAHGFYDEDDWNRIGVIYLPIHFYRKLEYAIKDFLKLYFRRCPGCQKHELFFGKNVGDHRDCAPF